MAGHAPVVQNPAALQGRVKPGEAPAQGPRVDLVRTLAHVRVRRRTRDAEQGAQVPRHDRILAAPHLAVEPRKRRKLETGHRKARHQTVGQADATGADRIGDAVKTLSHHVRHPGHRQMPAEGVSRGFCSCLPFFRHNSRFRRQKSTKKCFRQSIQPIAKQRKEILAGIAVHLFSENCNSLRGDFEIMI